VLESVYKDWWRGSLKGNTGIFPLNYVEKLTDPTPDELQREAQMEAEVFAEIKNVEKLLTLLSASNTGPREEDNEEISVRLFFEVESSPEQAANRNCRSSTTRRWPSGRSLSD
jgi:signal transducing adaptor molecule